MPAGRCSPERMEAGLAARSASAGCLAAVSGRASQGYGIARRPLLRRTQRRAPERHCPGRRILVPKPRGRGPPSGPGGARRQALRRICLREPGRAGPGLFVQQRKTHAPALGRDLARDDPAGVRWLEIGAEQALLPVLGCRLVLHGFGRELRLRWLCRAAARGSGVAGPGCAERGDTTGRLKIIFHRETKKVLGVHIIGEGACELLHIGQTVMILDGTVEYFVDTVFNYPTLAECYKAAAFNGLNKLAKL